MGAKYELSCYMTTVVARWNIYSGNSIIALFKAYRHYKSQGGKHFVLVWHLDVKGKD